MPALLARLRTSPEIAAFALFGILVALGFWLHADYGVPWDEPNMIRTGEAAYSAVFSGQPWTTLPAERFYGTVFELPVTMTMHAVGITQDAREGLLLRHLFTYLLFLGGACAFWRLAERLTGSAWIALLGVVFLVLSPRIFADAFTNSKDLPNLSLFTVAMWTLVRFLDAPTWERALQHALATGLAIGIRLTSLLIPPLTLLLLALPLATGLRGRDAKCTGLVSALYVISTVACTVAVWPFLWQDPVGHLREAMTFMSTLPMETFYLGRTITSLPWHYVPVWIAVSTPPLYTLLFLLGTGDLLARIARSPLRFLGEDRAQLLPVLWLVLPVLAVHASGAGIFDGWRHLYFLYPAFLLLALRGLQVLLRATAHVARGKAPWILGALVAVHSLWIGWWMVRSHPVQNVYFTIPAAMAQNLFELDYWGLSYRPALEYILALDPSPSIRVWTSDSPGAYTLAILRPSDQIRIHYERGRPQYILSHFRSQAVRDEYELESYFVVTVGGVEVLDVYKVP